MKLLNGTKIAGNTARLVETRFFNIINGAVCDKTNYSPRTLQFVENIMGCPLVPSTQRWIARVPAVEGLFENQQKQFIVDINNPKITYVAINQFHPSATGNYANVRLAKFEETEDGIKMLASSVTGPATTNAFIREIISQTAEHIICIVGTSNTNRLYIQRFNKSDLSLNLTMHDVGAWHGLDFIGESGDEMLLLLTIHATAAGKWTLYQRNKLTNVVTSVPLLTGHTSGITSYASEIKKVGDIVTQYRAYQKPTSPFNWIISKIVFDLSKVGATASATYMTSKIDYEITDVWLPNTPNAVVKLQEIEASNGDKYLVMFYMQTSVDAETAYGEHIVFAINAETGVLTKVTDKGEGIASSGVRGIIPLNNGRSIVAITRVGVTFATFDETNKKYIKIKEILTNPFSVGVTANEDIIVTDNDMSVHLYSNSTAIQVMTQPKTPISGNVPPAGLSNDITVEAFSSFGERIAIKVKLQIDGTNAIWDATGNREIIVTTSAVGAIDVPITITEGGDFVIRALNE